MTQNYQVTAITMHDDEVRELRALGIPITITNDVQDCTEFEVELSAQQVVAVRAHCAVIAVTEI
ncbi:MAG: hypothetical protein Q8T09_08110 [Candidatus Melainabacteria bacterium]|nr:hypothetical protein [Candidatus Melainabacteria bacterium]